MSNSKYSVIEIGEDSDMWLVVGQSIDVLHEQISISEAQVAIIEYLVDALLPGNDEAFADCVQSLFECTPRSYEFPIYGSEDRVIYRSPIGSAPIPDEFQYLGTCGVTFGFQLLQHTDILDE